MAYKHATVNDGRFDTCFFCELGYAGTFPVVFDYDIGAFVASVSFGSCPVDVSGFIVAIVVDAIEASAVERNISYVLYEGIKRVEPLRTH